MVRNAYGANMTLWASKSTSWKDKPKDNEKPASSNQNPLVLHLSLKSWSTAKKAKGLLVDDSGGAGASAVSYISLVMI